MCFSKTTISTIDDVIRELDLIIAESEISNSTLGYFAVLYRKVTMQVKQSIEETDFKKQIFHDKKRIEQLDVIFAKRYIDAYHNYRNGKEVTNSWRIAFELSNDYWTSVLQHLILGMNAHINLDLGIAAAEVMKGEQISDFEHDFNAINKILFSLVKEIEKSLFKINPASDKIIDKTKKKYNFSISSGLEEARSKAWSFALDLSELNKDQLNKRIVFKDGEVAKMACFITNPGLMYSSVLKMLRLGEIGSIKQKIGNLKEGI